MVSAAATSALAGGADGVWARTDGKARVRFAPCGSALCGTIVWLRDSSGPAQIGEQVFFNMQPAGSNRWTGSAHNPEDGRDYDGSMVLSGNRLTTKGCALGGMICKTVYWTRAR
jgi:uncharacterized protein (DUF2147 family)